MDERVLVFTANYGGRDRVQIPWPQNHACEWLYITDTEGEAPPPWMTLVAPPSEPHPNMSSKWHRTHPPFQRPGGYPPYDYAIWIDSNMQVTAESFVRDAIASVNDGIALWAHPRRDNILDEIEASLGAEAQDGRYLHLPLREQAAAYLADGYPPDFGLYATGTIVWTPERAADVGAMWFDECKRWGYQDQISFPYVCWKLGVKPGVFPVHQTVGTFNNRHGWWSNDWMRIHNHARET